MIEDFQSKISNQGLARSNKFLARVFPPRALSANTNSLRTNIGGSQLSVNLPVLDAIDTAITDLNNLNVDLGPVNVGYNLGLPTLGYLLGNNNDRVECINMFCAGANIPARDIASVQANQYGEDRQMGFMHIHSDFTLNYYCSEDLREREFFEQWQDLIFNPRNKRHSYYADTISRVEVLKYDHSFRNNVATYRFHEAYPTNIGAMTFDYGSSEITRLDISFKFRNYERV